MIRYGLQGLRPRRRTALPALLPVAMLASVLGGVLGGAAPLRAAALPESSPVPGGVMVFDLGPDSGPAPEVRFEGAPVLRLRSEGRWISVVGIPLAREPGPAAVEVLHGAARILPDRPIGRAVDLHR